jgi:hypothetical protein
MSFLIYIIGIVGIFALSTWAEQKYGKHARKAIKQVINEERKAVNENNR